MNSIDSIELKCKFDTKWQHRNFITYYERYLCIVNDQGDIILDRTNREISTISGTHLGSSSNIRVNYLDIMHSNVFYFPRGLEEKFNLLIISIRFSKLKEIQNEDLKPFDKLLQLDLQGNELQVIEKDLFKFNPNLEEINLQKNQISYIEPDVFEIFVIPRKFWDISPRICKLRSLYLGENICEVWNAEGNSDIVILVQEVERRTCTPRSWWVKWIQEHFR